VVPIRVFSASGRRSARSVSCNLYVTYELEKWSGRLDSNQRPPAPKIGADGDMMARVTLA